MDFLNMIIKNKLIILIVSVLLNVVLCLASGYLLYDKVNHECASNELSETETIEEISSNFFVEVKGAVNSPGVFKVDNSYIINDVIKLADGFTKKAYTKNINLSKKVSNELVIYVYTEAEYKKISEKETVIEIVYEECPTIDYDISECITSGSSEIVSNDNSNSDNNKENSSSDSIVEQDDNKTENDKNKLININTANKEELMTLNGIGGSKADAIIEYRKTTKFNTIEDIKNVSGIGEAAFEKIKDNITV